MAGQVISRLTSSGGNDAGVHVISSSFYGTCNSAANSENKEVIIQNRNINSIKLVKGMLLTVKFINNNTYGDQEGEGLPTLQIFANAANSDSAIPVKGTNLTINTLKIFAKANDTIKPEWEPNTVVSFIYDTYYDENNHETYGCWIKTEASDTVLATKLEQVELTVEQVESATTSVSTGLGNLITRVDEIGQVAAGAIQDNDMQFISWPIGTTPTQTPAIDEPQWQTNAPDYQFGYYIWWRMATTTAGSATPSYSDPVCISGRDGQPGQPGAAGASAYQYYLSASPSALINNNGTISPASVVFSVSRSQGTGLPQDCPAYFVIAEYNNGWSTKYSGNNNGQNSKSYSPSTTAATLIQCTIYDATNTSVQLDSQTVHIVKNGKDGQNGTSVTVDSIQYGVSENETTSPQSWNVTIPTVTPGWWLWTKTSYVGVTTPAISKSYIGTDGQDGISVTVQSINKTDGTTTVILDKGDGTTAALVIEDGTDGENGLQGPAGENGEDGISSYIHVAWANAIGTTTPEFVDFSRTNTENLNYLYMGTYTDTASINDSENPLDYSWTLIKGEDGEDSYYVYLTNENHTFAATTSAAIPATVSSEVIAYKGTTPTSVTFSSSLNTSPTEGITVTPHDSTNETNAYFTVNVTSNLTISNKYGVISIPVIVDGQEFVKDFSWSLAPAGANGTNAYNRQTILLYKRNPTIPTAGPSGNLTYTFSTGSLSPSENLNGWSSSFPSGTDPCWVIAGTAAAEANIDSDTIAANGGWSSPTLYVQNGLNQTIVNIYKQSANQPSDNDLPNAILTHTFASGDNVFGSNATSSNNWFISLPSASTTPTWMRSAVAISSTATDTIGTTEWSNPAVKYAQLPKSITSITEYYQRTNSTTTPAKRSADGGSGSGDNGWKTTIDQVDSTHRYLWNYEVITYNTGSPDSTIPHIVGTYAKDGTSVTISEIKYGKSNNVSTEPTNWYNETEWASQSIGTGVWIWVKTTYSNNSTSINKSYVGTNGTNGQPGASSYTHIAWANSANGQTDFSKTSSTNKTYLGICVNDTESDDSLTYDRYSWSLIQGKSIVSIINKYKRTTTAIRPSIQDNDWITPDDNTDIPIVDSINKYLWTYEETTYQNPHSVESTRPHLIGAYGDTGARPTAFIDQEILWPYDDSDLETHPAPTENASWTDGDIVRTWVDGEVVWESGKYIWGRIKIIWSDGTQENPHITYTDAVLANGINSLNEKLNNTIISSDMLWYTSSSSNIPNSPSPSIITTTANNVHGQWTKVVPLYDEDYPYYYYCYQQQKADNNYNWTSVVYDPTIKSAQDMVGAVSTEFASELNNYLLIDNFNTTLTANNSPFSALKTQVDNQLEIFYNSVTPATTNTPASNWNTNALKEAHIGDMCYNTATGQLFQWIKENDAYKWNEIENDAAARAIEAANEAKTTADGKRKIFTSTPVPPYDIGDLWVKGTEIRYANVARDENANYNAADWLLTATDDTIANQKIRSSTQLWYIAKKNDNDYEEVIPEVNPPTAHVTETRNTITETWTINIPLYNEDYPYYFYCEELWYGNNSYNWTTPAYDPIKSKTLQQASLLISDNDDKIEELKNNTILSSVQLWYAAKENTNIPTAPSTPIYNVNVEDNVYGNWTLSIPTYNLDFPYYYYCYQQQKADGTYTYTDVIFDKTKSDYITILQKEIDNTKEIIEATNQYFWNDGSGAHITEYPREEWTDTTTGALHYHKGMDSIWNAEGMAFRKDYKPLFSLISGENTRGAVIYDPTITSTNNIIASFTNNGIQLGNTSTSTENNWITITPEKMSFMNRATEVAYAKGQEFLAPNITVNSTLNFADNSTNEKQWAWIPRSNGNIAFKWIGNNS